MHIHARIQTTDTHHEASVSTDGRATTVTIPPKPSGPGSSLNGGELLFLALATCYGNDLFREAVARGIAVECVEVEVDGQFGGPGEPATGVTYRVRVVADAAEGEIAALIRHTDTVAEIHNTLRAGTSVTLDRMEAIPTQT
jgi:organic hydroperoxide reductase OsmC/OhrA